MIPKIEQYGFSGEEIKKIEGRLYLLHSDGIRKAKQIRQSIEYRKSVTIQKNYYSFFRYLYKYTPKPLLPFLLWGITLCIFLPSLFFIFQVYEGEKLLIGLFLWLVTVFSPFYILPRKAWKDLIEWMKKMRKI